MKLLFGLILIFFTLFIKSQNLTESDKKKINKVAQELAETVSGDTSQVTLSYKLGDTYMRAEYYDSALYFFQMSADFAIKSKENLLLSNSYNQQGYIYYFQGDFVKSINCFHKSLRLLEKLDNKEEMALALNNIATINLAIDNYEEAFTHFERSLKLQEEINDIDGSALTLSNMSSIYIKRKDYSKALELMRLSLDKELFLKDSVDISNVLCNIGYLYRDKEMVDTALTYYTKALTIQEKLMNSSYDELSETKKAMATTLNNIGEIYFLKGQFEIALDFSKRSLAIAKQLNSPQAIVLSAKLLKDIYKAQKDFHNALVADELLDEMKDKLSSESIQKEIAIKQTKYQYETKMLIDEEKHKNAIFIKQQEQKRQKIIIISVTLVLILVSLVLILIFGRLNQSKKQNMAIEKQKLVVETVNQKLEHLNKEVSDSINYAELIQQAVLPSLKIEDLTKESFIYFNPKDKVSGDFYWLEEKEEYSGFAVADCTGHGIPGAFISMIGTILLNEIYNSKKIFAPNEILDELSRLVKLTLTNKEGYTMKDGMDISFVALNNTTKKHYFSGANNPVWIISDDKQKEINKELCSPVYFNNEVSLYEIKGDKQPVGDFGDKTKPFTLNSIKLKEGDVFYLFSDGYVDQFGGEKAKKMKNNLYRELLTSINDKSMNKQCQLIDDYFKNWKGKLEQVDDVCVLGVKI